MNTIGGCGRLEVFLEVFGKLKEWVGGCGFCALFVLALLIQVAFCCGNGVGLICLKVMEGESQYGVDVEAMTVY